jgi:hypothetical protein
VLKKDVKLGSVYIAKVSNQLVPVQIVNPSSLGGWDARNLRTGRWIRIKSAAKLREKVDT